MYPFRYGCIVAKGACGDIEHESVVEMTAKTFCDFFTFLLKSPVGV